MSELSSPNDPATLESPRRFLSQSAEGTVPSTADDVRIGFQESKRHQWILLSGLGALLLPILFSVWAVTHLEETVKLQRQAFEIRAHLIEIDSQLKNWFVLLLARAKPNAVLNQSTHNPTEDEKAIADLETEIEGLFTQAETFTKKDREQFLRVIELRDKWRLYRDEYRSHPQAVNLSKLQELDEKFFDIDDLAFDTISAREPVMIRNMNLLLQIMIFLSFASLTIIAYALFAMRRENANKARIMVEMKELQEQALQASNLKSKFLATVSHEIRTPLNGIIGLSDLLRKTPNGGLSETHRSLVEIIFQSGRTLLRIINDILDYSKIESDQIDFSQVQFDVADVLNQVIFSLSSRASEKSIALIYELDPHLPKSVVGDPDRLAQVLYNLVGNAIKFTSSGSVTLKVRRLLPPTGENVRIEFSVEDTGIGISGNLDDLFRPFVQLQKTGTSGEPGTGLGLSIAKRLVEGMGGAIQASSEMGKGSRFWYELEFHGASPSTIGTMPSGQISVRAESPESVVPLFSSAQRFQVLLAEDNPTNQLIAQSMLGALGADVLIASNGKEAIAMAMQSNVSIVLMDCQMPVMDGFDATRLLRSKGFTRPIIALTANASKEDETKCMMAGMSGFIAKPLTVEALQKSLSVFLKTSQDESVNRAVLNELEKRIGRSAMNKVIESFLSTLPEFREGSKAAIAAQDLEALKKIGHRFKSSAASLGATEFAGKCKALESETSLDHAKNEVDEMNAMTTELETHFKAYLDSARG